MPLYTVLLYVQYASVALMLLECAYITKKWSSPLHGWLFFYCVSVLINNAGYLAYMQADTEDALVLCWQLVYLGKAWTGFSLFVFVLFLCRGKTYHRISTVLSVIHAITYFLVLKMRSNKLYYESYTFTEDGLFPHLEFGHGIWHNAFDALILIYIVIGIVLLCHTLRAQTDKRRKKQLFFIALAVLVDCACHILELIKIIPGYDMNAMGFSLASVCLFIAIFVYDFMNTKALAREFVIENIAEGIAVTDTRGCLIICNSRARKLLNGIAPFPDKAIHVLQGLYAEGKPLFLHERTFSINEELLMDKSHVLGKVYMLTDDTEHFRYIEELKEQKQIADKANRAKGEFLSNMSHEIRSPINAVLGLDEMILRESAEQGIREYAADIQSSGKMLLSVINDILDFSKIESGKMELVPADYDLSCLVSDLVNMIAARAEAKGLDFVVDIDEATPHLLYGDDTRLKQCVLNILTNAVKYTPKGSVTLSMHAEKIDETHCSLCVSVRDTGIGIKEEDIKKLFSPFERIEEGRNRAIEGTGLGMSIVKSLLAAMGTQLDVESVYGKGSCFSFRVVQQVRGWEPVGNYAETKAKSVEKNCAYTESFQAPGAKILVVDDTPVNLTVIRGLLKQTRIQIDTAENGISGLEKAKACRYDMIFVDHRMPKMDGMEMLAALRAEAESVNQHTVCVALTANAAGDVRQQYIDAGFSEYLSKPVEPRLLEEVLARYLPPELVLHKGDDGWVESASGSGMLAGAAASAENRPGVADAFFARRFGIDLAAALKNCAGEEVFAEAVQGFYDAIDKKAADIERFAAGRQWQDYTVQVHALKSSARLIGAAELSAQAAELEALGDRAKTADDAAAETAILSQTPVLLEAYRAYREKLAPLCAGAVSCGNPALPPLSAQELEERLAALREFAGAFDFANADMVMKDLAAHTLPADFLEQYEKLKEAVRAADSAAVLALL